MAIDSGRFSGHQSFTLRNTWLTKGVLECALDPRVFSRENALVTLGVGKNMVEAIRYWCLATRVLQEKTDERGAYVPTDIGRRLFLDGGGWDPYLEDVGSLWLLHWLLATHGTWATTIYHAFNEMNEPEFTREALERRIAERAAGLNARATENSIRRDVGVFIRSYVGGPDRISPSIEDVLDCPLAELGLLYEGADGRTYAFARGPKDSLPDAVVVYALWEYMQGREGQRTFTFDELEYRPGTPGRVFKLDEIALAERLERVSEITGGAWQFAETAGYKQVLVTRDIDAQVVLEEHYRQMTSGGSSDARH